MGLKVALKLWNKNNKSVMSQWIEDYMYHQLTYFLPKVVTDI